MASSTMEEPKLPGGYLVTPRVPQGLAAAVEGLTREVIRHSPEDIYVFAAHHFEKLLEIRDKCRIRGEKSLNRDKSKETLREMSRALRMREIDRGTGRTGRRAIDQAGWSLNQTAKVLKRHRSIFGDEGRRITTDEVYRMASQEDNQSVRQKSATRKTEDRGKRLTKEKVSSPKSDDLWKASTSRSDNSWSNEDSSMENAHGVPDRTRPGPKIITQIPNLPSGTVMLAKDIKTELRKNRISSKERRNVRARPEDKSTADKLDGKVVGTSNKSHSTKKTTDRQMKRSETEMEEKRVRKNYDSTKFSSSPKKRLQDGSKKKEENTKTRTPGMDKVKDYVVEKFVAAKSLEELQSSNYVERVQEIINETGPIIKEKIEQLKSDIAGRSERSTWFANARKTHAKDFDNSSNEKFDTLQRQNDSKDNSTMESSSTGDVLRTRLTETQNLLENVSSSLTRPSRRSRSARSSRRSQTLEFRDKSPISRRSREDDSPFVNQDNGLETKLSKTRDLLVDITSTLSRPTRRSNSANNLRRYQETTEDATVNKDALGKRLNETENLLKDIFGTLGKTTENLSRNKTRSVDDEEFSSSEGQTTSKTSLPAVKSISVKNSSGSVSRSESDNLVLPAISPEAPKSAKIKEELILPVLSPPGTASVNEANENISKILDSNDDVPLKDFEIPEMPVEDYIPEVPVENVSRDSLNVTPDFDSVPLRPDSLEPVEIVDDLQTKIPNVIDPEEKLQVVDNLASEKSEGNDLEAKESNVEKLDFNILETEKPDIDDREPKETNADNAACANSNLGNLEIQKSNTSDLETKLREIQEVERNINEAFSLKITSNSEEPASVVMQSQLRESEECEKRTNISDAEISREGKSLDQEVDVQDQLSCQSDNQVGRKMSIESGESNRNEAKEAGTVSPDAVDYTYILTEGSPYDIPNTVTTVIIPDRKIDSPLSDRLSIELEDGVEAKLTLIPGVGEKTTPISELVESADEFVDKNVTESDINDETTKGTEKIDSQLSMENIEAEQEKLEDKSGKNEGESSEIDSLPKNFSTAFGEYVGPETIAATSPDIEFIREIENVQVMQISHQDLGRINEEALEDLDDPEEGPGATKTIENSEKLEETRKETLNKIEVAKDEIKDEIEDRKGDARPDTSKVIESDLSPQATRPNFGSESSNETKESSVADEPLESAKCENSMDEEESSVTGTPESSNEVKETTLTDGLSLSLDPTRPYVPELNLDSLQDISVSSFKMTEDDYENQAPDESANTNSLDDTLVSEDNNRTKDNGEYFEQVASEYLSSSSTRSRLNEIDEKPRSDEKEITEEIIVKSQVEVKEDVCEKSSAYVTGPSEEEESVSKAEDHISKVRIELKSHETETMDTVGKNLIEPGNEDIVQRTDDEEETIKSEDSNGEMNVIGEDTSDKAGCVMKREDKDTTNVESANGSEIVEDVKTEVKNESISGDEMKERNKIDEVNENTMKDRNEETENKKDPKFSSENGQSEPEEIMPTKDPEKSSRKKKLELEVTNKDESQAETLVIPKPEVADLQRNEEIGAIDNEDIENKIIKDVEDKSVKAIFNEEFLPGDDDSDDLLEESYVEDETPLAVSRSASQCTTRRVSSGNLAKLREDPTLGWCEETEREDEENLKNTVPTKVTFSETTDETNKNLVTTMEVSNEINKNGEANDSTECHIYVPEVDVTEDSSTTESSTFDSAVTKIQAGVRGFLARRRLQRGQQNRSSTLKSIPSIQDSFLIEPYLADERQHEATEDKDAENQEAKTASSRDEENEDGFVNAATRIQSNYRGYKARKRLRRENAVQRTTLSMEKSFAESGLQHTGEFHDCIPLPIHEIMIAKKASNVPTDLSENSTDLDSEKISAKTSIPLDPENIFLSQSSNTPIIQFGVSPNVRQIVDLVVLAKEEAAIQSGYLNFITSVEDTESIIDPSKFPSETKKFQDEDEETLDDSLREPLALSGPPIGVIIEEVTSSGAENFMQANEDLQDETLVSTPSILIPEVSEEKIASPRCASPKTSSMSFDEHEASKNISNQSEVEKIAEGSLEVTNEASEYSNKPEKVFDSVESDRTKALSSNVEKSKESVLLETESTMEDFTIPESLSSMQEKELLGPESSVDSMDLAIARAKEKNTSGSMDSKIDASTSMITQNPNEAEEKMTLPNRSTSDRSEIAKEKCKEESIGSNVDDASSILSFSMKVEDLLGLGSEDIVKSHGKKSILDVTLTSSDLMKSMSQESQLAGERIESPITMIQIAPERSESLKQDEFSDNDNDADTTDEKK